MEFKGNVVHNIEGIWTNINEKYHYNDWHIHDFSTLSGVYYVKHDGSTENGDILFKHPLAEYMTTCHWPQNIVETFNMVTASCITVTPKSNMLLIFPSWLKHKVEANLKDDTRISSAFNSIPLVEKKS